MASDETQEMALSLKDMKKKIKQQKKAKKKNKKKHKMEKKIAKKEAKARKKGVFLDDLTTSEEEEVEVIEAEEDFETGPWVRKSTDDIPFLEKKIDMLGDRRAKSGLHELFEERFGESLEAPHTYQIYELTEREKRRLEALRALDEEEAVVQEVEAPPVEAEEVVTTKKLAKKAEVKAEGEEQPLSFWNFKQLWLEGEEQPLSFWNFKQLWLYSKYGKDKKKAVKYIIMIVSAVLWIPATIIRILYFLITLPLKLMKKMKARKAEKTKKATSESQST
jgi:hypothetical protein